MSERIARVNTRTDAPVKVSDEPRQSSQEYVNNVLTRIWAALDSLERLAKEEVRRVDEYQVKTLAPDSETVVTLQPQFDKYGELIQTVIVTGPPVITSLNAGGAFAVTAGGQTITSLALPAGTYQINWILSFYGTVTTADAGNEQLLLGSTVIAQSTSGGSFGGPESQTPITVTVPQGGATISIQSIAGGSGTATYRASLTATSLGATYTLQLGDRTWNGILPTTGIQVIPMAPSGLLLATQDVRQLTSTVAGEWGLELLGVADIRYKL